jgi:hypothetical protein
MDTAQRCQWRWLHQGVDLAMRVACGNRTRRAWVIVHPLDLSCAALRGRRAAPRNAEVYHVRRLEAPRFNLARIVHRADDEIFCTEEFFAYGDEHLSDRLGQRGLTIATFYPLAAAEAAEQDGQRVLRPLTL